MIKKTISNLYITSAAVLTTVAAMDLVRWRINRFADTQVVGTARKYVLVRLARGDYNKRDGLQTMRYDYKFFDIIRQYHD